MTTPNDDPRPQLGRDDLKRMSPEQVMAAKEAGLLEAILGRPVPVADDQAEGVRTVPGVPQGARPDSSMGQLTRADLRGMSAQEIEAARRQGRLEQLLGGR